MTDKKITIIGCGNLGQSILNGLLDSDVIQNENITITKRNTKSIEHFAQKGVTVTANNQEAVAQANIILVAVKPYHIISVIQEFSSALNKNQLIASLATGVTLQELQEATQNTPSVFRAMPNTAADVKESLTCIAHHKEEQHKVDLMLNLFNQIGESLEINENLMEAATVIGACGVAYVMRFIRAMIQGGVEIGFDAKTASAIVNQTVKGAAQLLIERGNHPEYEIDKVTTPKGCTIVGLNQMEHNGFSSSLIKGIVTSYEKIG